MRLMDGNRLNRIKISFLIAAVVLLSLCLYSYVKIDNLMKTSAWVNHTATVKLDLETYFSHIKDMESSMRGYLLSKDSLYIGEFKRAKDEAAKRMLNLRANTNDNYSQRENLKKLETIAYKRIDNMATVIAIKDFNKLPDSTRAQYRHTREELRQQIDKMLDEEDVLLRIRKKSLTRESTLTPWVAALLAVTSILLLIASYYAIYKELRTSNALRADLEGKNDTLGKMNEELESFTYISSHDLQEPLRKIQTFLSILLEKDVGNLSEPAKNYIKRSQDNANRMQNLIRDLLAYSRLNTEVFPVEPVRIATLVDEIRADFAEEIEATGTRIDVTGNPEVGAIVSQFRQLLINHISNSIKFAHPDRAPHIVIDNQTVRGDAVPLEGVNPAIDYARISIADNGVGFEPQYRDRIFKVFQRLHIDPQYKGTGIGLAIVKKIVDNHHGFITADSVEGQGATFTIYLPA
ncbi:sensor histidine kinase [Flavobacterium caeni]|uniref:histidine kinase n=1 Tax=Flavobacterium caeni TaxID=490189 RepID=A0A1G5CSG6_9FLAO|nr:sensor histidine kinase [Flavobacterium caeni]SCY05336.1 His Kinase A (phospho-acceptor) domain-containing protein [Flavobacterium caeni]